MQICTKGAQDTECVEVFVAEFTYEIDSSSCHIIMIKMPYYLRMGIYCF